MDARLLAYADRTAPRYTSYPTAPHFSAAVNGVVYAAWLGALAPEARLSLYLHIPFCREICRYCGCHTFATRKDEPIAAYTDALEVEIARVAATTPARRIASIAWGGGTPNILEPALFERIVRVLHDRFDLTTVTEHAIEIDPRLLTDAHAAAFARAGVTRASLGVQDLNAHVQDAIGRVQPAAQVSGAIGMLRGAGIGAINVDLMYGLPLQSVADARRSAVLAAEMGPERLAVFGYAHVPWFKSRQRLIEEELLPDTATRFAQAEAIQETLMACGYHAIGFDHYARPDDPLARAAQTGALTRSFQGYSLDDGDALIGIGASAISTLPQGYAQNAAEPGAWARALEGGGFATARGVALSDEDRVRRTIINRLLCDFAVDLAPFGSFGAFPAARAALAPLIQDGLVSIAGERLTIPPDARPFARLVAEAFDAYRAVHGAQGAARHSRAV